MVCNIVARLCVTPTSTEQSFASVLGPSEPHAVLVVAVVAKRVHEVVVADAIKLDMQHEHSLEHGADMARVIHDLGQQNVGPPHENIA